MAHPHRELNTRRWTTPQFTAPITRDDIPVVPDSRVRYGPAPRGAAPYSVKPSKKQTRERTDVAQTMHRVPRTVVERSERED